MLRPLTIAALAALAVAAGACARKPPQADVAKAAQTLLTAAWRGDAQAFEAGVDRPAVRADLRQQLLSVARANGLAVDGGASDAALDRMITPDAFRLADAGSGQPLAAAPSQAQTEALIKLLAKDRACLHDQSPQQACLLTFARGSAGWRLVGMAPAGFVIAVRPEPPKTNS